MSKINTKAGIERQKINSVLARRGFHMDGLKLIDSADNPIVVKTHKCSQCGREWKEEINKYAGTYAFCPDCAGQQVLGWREEAT